MARSVIDISGNVFGRLTVVNLSHINSKGAYWNCLCVCGNTKSILGTDLRNGHSSSCGCMSSKKEFLDLSGKHIGLTQVIDLLERKGDSSWRCMCYCGNEFTANSSYLLNNRTIPSCGCHTYSARAQGGINNMSHGHTVDRKISPEYSSWMTAKRSYKDSCEEFCSFERFLAIVGRRPAENYMLRIIDIEKGFAPGNVEWREYKKSDKPRKPRQKKPPAPKPAALPTLPWAKPKQAA